MATTRMESRISQGDRWLSSSAFFWEEEPPASYLTLPFLFYLWLRGIIDGSRELDHKLFMSAFVGGCTSLVLYFLLLAPNDLAPPDSMGSIVLLFFGTAMVMLALSSVKTERVHWIGAAQRLLGGIHRQQPHVPAWNMGLSATRWDSSPTTPCSKLVRWILRPVTR